jgi:hypothetical protein
MLYVICFSKISAAVPVETCIKGLFECILFCIYGIIVDELRNGAAAAASDAVLEARPWP